MTGAVTGLTIPVVHRALAVLVSPRVGNYEASVMWGTYYDQLWVR